MEFLGDMSGGGSGSLMGLKMILRVFEGGKNGFAKFGMGR
jgi:hypothetical protein